MSVFQSTPSARRATSRSLPAPAPPVYFNPRPPRGERRDRAADCAVAQLFQSTPSARRATGVWRTTPASNTFQSTPSARRATRHVRRDGGQANISIHALREESDTYGRMLVPSCVKFQSTPSARRATVHLCVRLPLKGISIHALREESDAIPPAASAGIVDFNPRPPRGERLRRLLPGLSTF